MFEKEDGFLFKLIKNYTGKKYMWAAIVTPLLMIVEVWFDVQIPSVMSEIIDVGVKGGAGLEYIYSKGITMCLLSLAAMGCGILAGFTSSVASSGFVLNLRNSMYEKVQTYSFANIEKFEVPSLVTRMTKDMRELRMAYNSIVRQLMRAPVNLALSAYMVYKINKDLAVVFAVAVPILGVGLYLIATQAHPRFRILMSKFDRMNAALEENFVAIRVVKTFVREQFEKIKFAATSQDVVKSQLRAESIVILNEPFFNLIMYICMIVVTWKGGNFVIQGSMTEGQLMSYVAYLKSILFSLLGLSMVLMQIIMSRASVDRANEILNEIVDLTDEQADPKLQVEDGSIEFKNVGFSYSKNPEKLALTDINVSIKAGETVGVIGSTGSGKTSLIQLIPRLYDTTLGEVRVGGHNVKEYTMENLRESVSVVLQKNVLFSGTIEENMKWGNPNATHEEVVEACKCAQADDFISAFPEGYNRDLGQGGVNVSGGQKQRLCIARALLKKPKIIILDDSTSAVDTDTDKRIRKALKERLSGMTTIIIAQRIASVMDADKIIVLDDGKVMDMGTHEELLARNEVYSDLYTTQAQGVAE